MVGVMYALGIENPFISAIIPACGYFISTLTLWFLKHRYVKQYLDERGK